MISIEKKKLFIIFKLVPSSGQFEEVDAKNGFSFQFMSTSVDGVILFWDLNSPPVPFVEAHINKDSFQRPGQFRLPKTPKGSESKYKELYMRWNPFYKVCYFHNIYFSYLSNII